MAINTTAMQNPVAATAPKKKGSGFVSFDKAADQNKIASQAIGTQIANNIGNQVQSVQGQVQNEQGAVKTQLDSEANRLAGSVGVAQGIAADPTAVDKTKYQDLISGTAKQADTKAIQGLAGSLGTTAQVAQSLSSDPNARQQAIQQVAKRPSGMQNLMGVQANLDSMLLGRNVNTQEMANKTARSAFDVDRLVGSVVKNAGDTGKDLQAQAQDARNVLRAARTTGIEGTEAAGVEQASTQNTDLSNYRNYLGSNFMTDLLGTSSDPLVKGDMIAEYQKTAPAAPTGPNAYFEKAVADLKASGFDPYTADVADLGGAEGAKARILASMGTGLYDSTSALNASQRNNLKSLYGLEDETYNSALDTAPTSLSGYNTDALKTMAGIAEASKVKTQELANQANFSDAARQAAALLQRNIAEAQGNTTLVTTGREQKVADLYQWLTGNKVDTSRSTDVQALMRDPNIISNLLARIESGDLERSSSYTGAASAPVTTLLNNTLGADRLATIQNYRKRLGSSMLIDPNKAP